MSRRSSWGPLAIIITLLAVAAIIFGFMVFGPAMLGSANDDRGLEKYVNQSDAGNETIIVSEGTNSLFAGMYSGPLRILMYIVGIFLIIASLVYAVSINRKKRGGM